MNETTPEMVIVERIYAQQKAFYDAVRRGDPSHDLFASFVGGQFAAVLAYDDDRIRKRVNAGGCLLFPSDNLLDLMSPGAREFIRTAIESGYTPEIWCHKPSQHKTDIGYGLDEVAITLAYATSADYTTYLMFTRDREDRRVPRRIIKKLLHTKDLEAAARQAEENIRGKMGRGSIGPFNVSGNLVGAKDHVYVHDGSYKQSEQNPDLLVNFSAGPDTLSFNMRLIEAVDIMKKSDAVADVCDLFGSDV